MWSTHTYFSLSFFSFILQVLLKKCKSLQLPRWMCTYLFTVLNEKKKSLCRLLKVLKLFFPSWEVGFTSFLQICLCHSVLEFYARKLCCMLWSPMEGKRADSAFGNCHIHLVTEIDMVVFRYDCSCEAKWLIEQ